MTKIDKRKSYKLVLDTETCPLDKDMTDVNPYNMWVYDIGWAIVDKNGTVYETRSFIVGEIFFGESDLMQSAYYKNKIPQYMDDIKDGTRIMADWYTIRTQLHKDCEKYGIKEIYAHNMYFDYRTVNTTQRWITKSKYRYFFPYGCDICDTLKMARDVIEKMPSYRTFCEIHGIYTKTGRISYSAENLYKFIINDPTYIEEHTALEDVMIEKEILAYCYKQHKKMRKILWEKR